MNPFTTPKKTVQDVQQLPSDERAKALKAHLDKLDKKADKQLVKETLSTVLQLNKGADPAKVKAQAKAALKKNQKKVAQGKTNNYLSNEKLQEHMGLIHDYNFKIKVDAHGREACRQIAMGFTFVIPHIDRYTQDMQGCDITEADLQRHYDGSWQQMNQEYRNKIRKSAEEYNKSVKLSLEQLKMFANRQSLHLNKMEDDVAGMLLDMEPTEVELMVSRNLRTYIQAGHSTEAYWVAGTELCETLAQLSKGLLYLTPSMLAKELKQRGFTSELRQTGKSKLRYYYVELVK
jgi:hypothetical protein